MAFLILKSRINETIKNAREQERCLQEREWKRRLDRALSEQKEIYEMMLAEKSMSIETLENLIEQNKVRMDESLENEMKSKKIYLKAKEIIAQVDYEYKRSLENAARSSVMINKIRDESEKFMKTFLIER